MTAASTPGRVVPAVVGVGDIQVPRDPARITTWTIVIPSPGWWLTSNNVLRNDFAQSRRIKAWRDTAFAAVAIVRPRIPKGLERVQVDICFRWAKKPVRELVNMANTVKPCVDGAIGPAQISRRTNAAGYGIVADDSDRRVVYGPQTSELIDVSPAQRALDPYFGEVVLTVIDLSGGAG